MYNLGSDLQGCISSAEQVLSTSSPSLSESVSKDETKDSLIRNPHGFRVFMHEKRKNSVSVQDSRSYKLSQPFEDRLKKLNEYINMCKTLDGRLNKLEHYLQVGIKEQHHNVSVKTMSLNDTCKALLAEQVKLQDVVSSMQTPLKIFSELDRIGPLFGMTLSAPDDDSSNSGNETKKKDSIRILKLSPNSKQFKVELAKLDECIAFMENYPQFQDYELYSSKFLQLQVRGLTLIRNTIVDAIQATTDSAMAALQTKQQGKDDARKNNAQTQFGNSSLVYVRYKALAAELRDCIVELENRTRFEDANALLLECQQSYATQRSRILVQTILGNPLTGLKAEDRPSMTTTSVEPGKLVAMVRTGCSKVLDVCIQEHQLFCAFFPPGKGAIHMDNQTLVRRASSESKSDPMDQGHAGVFASIMGALCSALYDEIRPWIVVHSQMDDLCEVVRVLQGEIFEGQLAPRGSSVAPLAATARMILRDTQERLVYCTHQLVRDDIAGYAPTSEDLDYPKRLMPGSAANENKNMGTKALYNGWFVTLERTLLCLSKVYRCVENNVFEGLAQEAVDACTTELKSAARQIASKASTTEFDGDLFLIKHLLVLREQITPFNVEFATTSKSLDFSTTTAALAQFVSQSRMIFTFDRNNALVELWSRGVPTVQEEHMDSKKNLEANLKEACDVFIKRATKQILGPILPTLEKASAFAPSALGVSVGEGKIAEKEGEIQVGSRLKDQSFASPDAMHSMLKGCEETMAKELEKLSEKLEIYLVSPVTQSIMFKPVRTNSFGVLVRLANCVETEYTKEEATPMLDSITKLKSILSSSFNDTS